MKIVITTIDLHYLFRKTNCGFIYLLCVMHHFWEGMHHIGVDLHHFDFVLHHFQEVMHILPLTRNYFIIKIAGISNKSLFFMHKKRGCFLKSHFWETLFSSKNIIDVVTLF